jgi:hypothetical protein
MLQTVEQRDQNDLETGAFRDNALTIARDKFGLNSAEGNKYANNEQVRYESLMEIRQKGKADEVNKIVKDAEYVYNREKDNTIDYKDGKIIRLTPKEAAYRADQEANKIIDNYISSNDPSDPSYISPDSEISR